MQNDPTTPGFAEDANPAVVPPAERGVQRVQLTGPQGEADFVHIPVMAGRILRSILEQAGGDAEIVVVPAGAEFSVERAAELMNVRPAYVSRLVEEGRLAARIHGSELQLSLAEVVRRDAASFQSFLRSTEEITAIDQELGLR